MLQTRELAAYKRRLRGYRLSSPSGRTAMVVFQTFLWGADVRVSAAAEHSRWNGLIFLRLTLSSSGASASPLRRTDAMLLPCGVSFPRGSYNNNLTCNNFRLFRRSKFRGSVDGTLINLPNIDLELVCPIFHMMSCFFVIWHTRTHTTGPPVSTLPAGEDERDGDVDSGACRIMRPFAFAHRGLCDPEFEVKRWLHLRGGWHMLRWWCSRPI